MASTEATEATAASPSSPVPSSSTTTAPEAPSSSASQKPALDEEPTVAPPSRASFEAGESSLGEIFETAYTSTARRFTISPGRASPAVPTDSVDYATLQDLFAAESEDDEDEAVQLFGPSAPMEASREDEDADPSPYRQASSNSLSSRNTNSYSYSIPPITPHYPLSSLGFIDSYQPSSVMHFAQQQAR